MLHIDVKSIGEGERFTGGATPGTATVLAPDLLADLRT